MLVCAALFLGPEIYALVSNSANTLSAWVWRALKIHDHESFSEWSALDYLTFGLWLVLVSWLSLHFWFGRDH
jgi:hypothetical protein